MSETPRRSTGNYSPVILPRSPSTSQGNLTGHPRIIRDSVADLYNNIQRWNNFHIKGAAIVKQIAIIKSDTPKYTKTLENSTNELYDLVQNLRGCRDKFTLYLNQIEALVKLDPESILFISLTVGEISKIYREISEAYLKEFERKVFVLEHIAHCKDKNEVMFIAALWTYQTSVDDNIDFKLEILLMESGHKRINK